MINNFFKILFLIVIIFQSCTSREYFSVTRYVKGEVIELEESYRMPRIALLDTILVITDNANNPVVFIYHLPSFRLIANIGNKGKGPGELQGASGIDIENTHKIWVYDFYKLEFLAFDPDSIHSVQTVRMPPEERQPHLLYANFISEHEYAVYRPDLKAGIFRLYQNGQCVKALGKLKEHPGIPDETIFQVYMGLSKYNPRLKKMAVAYMHTNKIDIINMETDSIITIYGEDFFEPEFAVSSQGSFAPNDQTTFAYRFIDIDDQYIYTLYHGGLFKARGESHQMHVFDWEGHPVGNYLLDHSAAGLAVDSKNKKIYTISPDANNNPVVYDFYE